MAANALQAVLDKASREPTLSAPVAAAPDSTQKPAPRQKRQPAKATARPESDDSKFYRPVRDGRRFVGAHFPPEVARQIRLIAAEDDTTIQALLEEAIDLLFVKKGRSKISALMNS